MCHQLGEISKRSPGGTSPTPRQSLPWHLCASCSWSLKTLVGYRAVPLILCGLRFSGSWKVPAKGTVHPCVCLGHRHRPVHVGKQSRTSEMPNDPPSSDVGNRIPTQEPGGRGRDDKEGTWHKRSDADGNITLVLRDTETRARPGPPRGTGGNHCRQQPLPPCPRPPAGEDAPQGGDHRAGVQGGPGAFVGKGGWVSKLQISAITVLFVKKHDWHVFTIKNSGCWTLTKGKKISSFGHSSKADVTCSQG